MSKTSHLTLKLRIKKPGKHLIQTFRKHLGDARFVHNSFLFERNFDFDDYLEEVESRQCWGEASTKEEARKLSTPPAWLNGYTFDRRLPSFKEMYPFLKDSYSSTLQKVAQNLERTYIKFIDGKCGLPHFKRKDAKEESIRFPSGVKFDQDNCQVYLPKIGWVRYFDDGRRIQHPEKIKAATLKRTDDQYDLLLTFKKECPEPKKIDPAKHKGTGLDVGTKYLLTNELGEHQESLSTKTKTFEERKAKKQKRLKNKTKGSRAS